ncbi:MAG: hypothetical protein J5701_01005 [Bacteroidales bacterium]|nr:hypothetical protein [Bacteroidales bacterium]
MKKVLFLLAACAAILSCSKKEVSCIVTVNNDSNHPVEYQLTNQDKKGNILSISYNYIAAYSKNSHPARLQKGTYTGLTSRESFKMQIFDYYDCQEHREINLYLQNR